MRYREFSLDMRGEKVPNLEKVVLMGKNGPRIFKKGDLITVSVPAEYTDVATEFHKYCREHHINVSDLIRGLMYEWLRRRKMMETSEAEPIPPVRIKAGRKDDLNISEEIFKQVLFNSGGDS
jgi:hypothetical protein